MTRHLKREIKLVKFAGEIGYVTSDELLAARKLWQHWRAELTRGRQNEGEGYKATCALCEGRVYISVASSGDELMPTGRRVDPYFKHYDGEGTDCKWYTGETLSDDDRRRLQYGGRQESNLHEYLCETIYKFVSSDTRCIKSLWNKYLPKNEQGKDRRPDVYVELAGLKPIAIELQLSNTFQTEIVARTTFYNQGRIGLIWIFHGVQPDKETLPTSLNDVAHQQRNNAFVLDYEARIASHEQQTLVVKCYLKTETGYDAGRLVRVDQLIIPKKGCMYLEDRLAEPMLREMAAYRTMWEAAIEGTIYPDLTEKVAACLNSLRKELPGLDFRYESSILIKFISTVLAIVADAKGAYKKFASRQKNVTGMVNTYLNLTSTSGLVSYAILLEKLIQSAANRALLSGTVGEHIERAKKVFGHPPNYFVGLQMESDAGKLLTKLVPEIFHKNERAMLMDFDLLPSWAR
jgi:hypothetical protein